MDELFHTGFSSTKILREYNHNKLRSLPLAMSGSPGLYHDSGYHNLCYVDQKAEKEENTPDDREGVDKHQNHIFTGTSCDDVNCGRKVSIYSDGSWNDTGKDQYNLEQL